MVDAKREMRANQFSTVLGALYGEPEEKRKDLTGDVGKLLSAIEYLLKKAKEINEELKQIENCGAQLPKKVARLSLVLDQLEKVNDDLPEVITTEIFPEIFSTPTRELGFTTRTENCLISDNIRTLKDVVLKKIDDLRRIPNLGKGSLEEIVEILKRKGLALGMTLDELRNYRQEGVLSPQ